jgi:hypothetical protein
MKRARQILFWRGLERAPIRGAPGFGPFHYIKILYCYCEGHPQMARAANRRAALLAASDVALVNVCVIFDISGLFGVLRGNEISWSLALFVRGSMAQCVCKWPKEVPA